MSSSGLHARGSQQQQQPGEEQPPAIDDPWASYNPESKVSVPLLSSPTAPVPPPGLEHLTGTETEAPLIFPLLFFFLYLFLTWNAWNGDEKHTSIFLLLIFFD